jgi:acetyl-CoA C-acetyltransferase
LPTNPRTPVLVGVAAVSQREEDPDLALEPARLMAAALELAAEDAGDRELLARADVLSVPRGMWAYSDPARLVAQHVGARSAKTELFEIGVLQTALFGEAAARIAAGSADVVLLAGGEAKYREQHALRAGREAELTAQDGVTPDRVVRPHGMILSRAEIEVGLGMPVGQYAMIENAVRAAEGIPLGSHLQEVSELWSAMSLVAAQNPDAWSRSVVTADTIRTPSDGNRMLAFPYARLHNSQWNVDQAAGLVMCSAATARTLGIPRERWVLPLAVADSNHMLPLTRRRALHRAPGFARAGALAFDAAGCDAAGLAHLELYSCFPVAVRVQLRELGIVPDRPLTVTGGMAFAGGPLNNFVLQAVVRMAKVLRGDPGSVGLVTAVSGVLTKQGVSLWSTEPGPAEFLFADVTDEAARDLEEVNVVRGAPGSGPISTYTVLYENERPSTSVLLCDLADGTRSLVASPDPALAEELVRAEGCGRHVRIAAGGEVELG